MSTRKPTQSPYAQPQPMPTGVPGPGVQRNSMVLPSAKFRSPTAVPQVVEVNTFSREMRICTNRGMVRERFDARDEMGIRRIAVRPTASRPALGEFNFMLNGKNVLNVSTDTLLDAYDGRGAFSVGTAGEDIEDAVTQFGELLARINMLLSKFDGAGGDNRPVGTQTVEALGTSMWTLREALGKLKQNGSGFPTMWLLAANDTLDIEFIPRDWNSSAAHEFLTLVLFGYEKRGVR